MHNSTYFMSANGGFSLGNAGLAEGTNANTIKTTVAVDYVIDSVVYSKAITDNIAMTAQPVQAVSTTCQYAVTINAAGTVAIRKGTEQPTGSGFPLTWPNIPATDAVLGAIKVVTGAAATFTSGSTDLSAAGVTATYVNAVALPKVVLA